MFLNPEKIISKLGLLEGHKVADFGAGNGVYSVLSAKKVGLTGRVYAIEVHRELVTTIRNLFKKEGVEKTTEVIWADFEKLLGTKIKDEIIDRAILANTLFLLPDKKGALMEIKRVMKPGSKIMLIDWSDSFDNMGPVPDMVVTSEMARELFEKNGFRFVENVDGAGDHHYGMIFERI